MMKNIVYNVTYLHTYMIIIYSCKIFTERCQIYGQRIYKQNYIIKNVYFKETYNGQNVNDAQESLSSSSVVNYILGRLWNCLLCN